MSDAPSSPGPIPAVYATASADAVTQLVATRYGLAGRLTCKFLNRGFNDIYRVRTEAGEQFVLRLSSPRARGAADVDTETAFLADLEGAGVPVAAAVPTRDGALFTDAALPDGPRPAVLFRYIEGRRPELDTPEDARIQGVVLARLHDRADRYQGREDGRYRLDLDHLLHRPLAAIMALDSAPTQAKNELLRIAARLADSIERFSPLLHRTRCHGDCHGLNARIPAEGPWAGQAVFFDFDDGGFGYLAYDLAVHLWAQVSFGRRRQAMWHAFRTGYESVRKVSPADEAAIPIFVAIRHIWLLGSWAGQVDVWGTEALSPDAVEHATSFLLQWERDQLSPRLL